MTAVLRALWDVHTAFHFKVIVESPRKIFYTAFTECVLPTLSVETTEIKEGGQNEYTHKLPVRVNVGNVTLKRGMARDSNFIEWYVLVSEGKIEKALREVTIVMFDSLGLPLTMWHLHKAYPVKWTGPTLKAGDSAIAIESIELAHHGFENQPM